MSWIPVKRSDARAIGLFNRHYSTSPRPGRRSITGPGETLVLLTPRCDAVFVWLRNTVERWDKQTGVQCTVFRNESAALASNLILEAEELAAAKWPAENRMFTYVNPSRIQSNNPGYCFQCAGWRKAGHSQSGLLLMEKHR